MQDARDVEAGAMEPGVVPRPRFRTIKMTIPRRPYHERSGGPLEVTPLVPNARCVVEKHKEVVARTLRAIDKAGLHALVQTETVQAKGFPSGLTHDVQLEMLHR